MYAERITNVFVFTHTIMSKKKKRTPDCFGYNEVAADSVGMSVIVGYYFDYSIYICKKILKRVFFSRKALDGESVNTFK